MGTVDPEKKQLQVLWDFFLYNRGLQNCTIYVSWVLTIPRRLFNVLSC